MINQTSLQHKEIRAYLLLAALVIVGLAGSLITAPKVVSAGGIHFPFSNIVFSLLTYPLVDCICELWGKKVARQTLWLALGCQILLTFIIQVSILTPAAAFWELQPEYKLILGTGTNVVIASCFAFTISQLADIVIYQRIKELCNGKFLWLRSNISTYLGQIIDSIIFVLLVFHSSNQKLTILSGSITIKIILSLLMTPIVYLIVISINRYLDSNTFAFKNKEVFETG